MARHLIDVTGTRLAGNEIGSGVTRVERELSSRAHKHLSYQDLYVYYSSESNKFLSLGSAAKELTKDVLGSAGSEFFFKSNDKLVSFGLECNNKNYRELIHLARAGTFKLYSVLYDLTGPLNPQLTIPGYGDFLRGFFCDMMWGVSHFYAISHHSKSQLEQLKAEEHLPDVQASVFRLGSDLALRQHNSEDISTRPGWIEHTPIGRREFVVYVSTIESRKNHYGLYRAWSRAVGANEIDPSQVALVFAGKPGWGTEDLLVQIAADPNTSDSVVMLHGLADDHIVDLYTHARFTVFSSFDEGFGLPVAESLSVGTPCIISSAGSLPEITNGNCPQVDPLDIMGWRSMIVKWLRNPDLVCAQRETISKSYESVTWDDSADQFYGLVKAN